MKKLLENSFKEFLIFGETQISTAQLREADLGDYVKNSDGILFTESLSVSEILKKYKHCLTKKQIKELKGYEKRQTGQ